MNRRDVLKDSLLLTGLFAIAPKSSFAEKQNLQKEEKRKSIIRKVAQLGNKCLRIKTRNLSITDRLKNKRLDNLIDDMAITLDDTGGVGIASAQVYEDMSLFLFVNDMDTSNVEVAINPKIINHSSEKSKGYEGCLSVPGIRALVPRYNWIEVEYIDKNNKKIKIKYSDFIARIFQHEFDHLNGIIYLDRVETNRDIISEEEYTKLPEESKKR